MCNYIGNLAWTLDLEWSGKAKYNVAKSLDYMMEGFSKKSMGETRSYGPLTYLRVYDAGRKLIPSFTHRSK
jgi:cathepsin A (carboxypeptidase C)